MTIEEAIAHVDNIRPNQYTHEMKVKWLGKLDGMIYEEVLCTHADNPLESFEGYESADPGTELIVPFPYDEDVYSYFLQAMMDKENGETQKYNQNITLYNAAYLNYWNYWNRNHTPLPSSTAWKF